MRRNGNEWRIEHEVWNLSDAVLWAENWHHCPGATFPDCPRHPKLTTEWTPVIEADNMINLTEISAKTPKPAA
jgi:hypothetical protein